MFTANAKCSSLHLSWCATFLCTYSERKKEKIPTLITLLQLLCPEQDKKKHSRHCSFKKGQLFFSRSLEIGKAFSNSTFTNSSRTWKWRSNSDVLSSESEEWTGNLKNPKIEMSLCYPFSLYMTIPLLLVFTKAETDLLPFSSWSPNSSSSFLSNRKAALKRAGYFPDAFWHGLQLHVELHCLCTWLLKTAEGENGKGSTQSVSHGLMRRQGLCQSLQEPKTQQSNLSRISALSG